MSIDRIIAIQKLVGGAVSRLDDEITYQDGQTPPTEEEIDAEIARLEKEFSDNEYARKRQAEYPKIRDVTVALAEKAEGDSTMWDTITAERAAVKVKFPKPE